MAITIKRVSGKKELKKFIRFNYKEDAGASVSLQAGSKAIPASVVLEMTKRISGCSANFMNSSF